MASRATELSPSLRARIAGAFYLLTILARMFVEIFVRNRFIVSDSPAATATNIFGHESLFRIGFAADNVSFAAYLVLTALLYELLKPGERDIGNSGKG